MYNINNITNNLHDTGLDSMPWTPNWNKLSLTIQKRKTLKQK